MTTNRFQPGDKVRVLPSTQYGPVSLGLNGDVYTVAHVDDFGLVQVKGHPNYFHPSHFELVMRKVWDAAASYSLKDGEGDWWILDTAPDAVPVWRMVDRPDVLHDAEDGIEEIARDYGIDGTPTAPETYCLKDSSGDWWTSDNAEEGYEVLDNICSLPRSMDAIVYDWGIDAEPIPAVAGVTVYEPGNSTGPRLHFEAAPLQPGDWVKVLARVEQVYDNGSVRALTFQSEGERNGPSVYAIASAITRTDEVPEWAKPAPCGSLWKRTDSEGESVLLECDQRPDPGHIHGADFLGARFLWTDSTAYGRVEVTQR